MVIYYDGRMKEVMDGEMEGRCPGGRTRTSMLEDLNTGENLSCP